MIDPQRVMRLNERGVRDGAYVLYWMQQSQRASGNLALDLAVREANERRLPIVVGFGLTADYPDANARHYTFMLQGLQDVTARLRERGIGFVVRTGSPDAVALALAGDAALVVCDCGYLRHQRAWRQRVAEQARCAVVQVEHDVVVPVELVSSKSEHAARTIRPKILRHRDHFIAAPEHADRAPDRPSVDIGLASDIDLADVPRAVASLGVDDSVRPVRRFTGGTGEARARLRSFLNDRLAGYAEGRNEPADWQCSFMSPYLHFGHVAPAEVALAGREAAGRMEDRAAYLEELIVRRELSCNYVRFQPHYDRYESLPPWARETLRRHAADRRDHVYATPDLEAAATHDPYWNAAMREMVHTGFMHNYMRMYWAKKILEWSPTPEAAFSTALALNNKYFLDGRDANSYANIAWCFGLHDRAWTERPVFGKVRYMNAGGLKRKFDMDRYMEAVNALVAAERR
ncbi:MAG: deoxyribodipyrimidine photo-lyase [Rhodospirillales bacterium]|nr:deoxyribodipyrimidine photo-lyase [Rhodospirillales bacterium]